MQIIRKRRMNKRTYVNPYSNPNGRIYTIFVKKEIMDKVRMRILTEVYPMTVNDLINRLLELWVNGLLCEECEKRIWN